MWFSDPEDAEVLSSTSDPEEPEVGEDELQAAAQHLTQDFLCQVIQEEGVQGKKTDDSEQEVRSEKEDVGPQRQAAPLAVILGKLPSTTTLGLQQTFQTFDESDTGDKPDGKNRLTFITSSQTQIQVLLCLF